MPRKARKVSTVVIYSSDGWREVPFSEVKGDWKKAAENFEALANELFKVQPGGLPLNSATIGLTITAEGKLAFIAKAGITASVTLVFKAPS
jgi:hypothetical protein